MYHFADAISANLFSKRCQCDRSIPPKQPIYRPPEVAVRPKHPKFKNEFVFRFSYLTFENEKHKNEFVFRFSYFTFENEKRKRNSFFVRKFENEKRKRNSLSVFRSQICKRKRKKRYIHGPYSHFPSNLAYCIRQINTQRQLD